MKTKSLYIIRHAKAEPPSIDQDDFDRDLLPKGIARAMHIAQKLKAYLPDVKDDMLVLSSTANRAAQTAKIFCEILGYSHGAIVWDPQIYDAHLLSLMKRLNDVPATYNHVLLFGHNPGVSSLVGYTTEHPVGLNTGHVACLTLAAGIDYSLLSANTAYVTRIITENG